MANFQHCTILNAPADYHISNKGVYIDYYYSDASGRHRKMIRCNRLVKRTHSRQEMTRLLKAYCARINASLLLPSTMVAMAAPELPEAEPRPTLHECLRLYMENKMRFLRPATVRTYQTAINKLLAETPEDLPVDRFTATKANLFLDAVCAKSALSNRAFNNTLKQARAVFEWFIERDFIEDNPFRRIRPRRTGAKKRTIIAPADCRRMMEWAAKNKPYLQLVMLLMHSALIRPKEIAQLRCEDVHLNDHYIQIRGDVAKNHNDRMAALTPQIEALLEPYLANRHKHSDFLVGRDNRPAETQMPEKRFLKDFYLMKADLKLPDNYQLYSLRDTGITALIKNGVDDITVMQHADHSSLKITSMYALHKEIDITRDIYSAAIEM